MEGKNERRLITFSPLKEGSHKGEERKEGKKEGRKMKEGREEDEGRKEGRTDGEDVKAGHEGRKEGGKWDLFFPGK
jgi:hypothetical protein